VDKEELR